MRIGFVGLGKMGGGMVERLLKAGHEIVGFDPNRDALEKSKKKGAWPATSLEDLVNKLSPPRAVWIMVPSGRITEDTIQSLSTLMGEGDILIDGRHAAFRRGLFPCPE